jgi:hypothetical protein
MRGSFLSERDIGTMAAMSSCLGRTKQVSPWMATFAIAAIGCDAQVTPDFREPIDSFRGEIRSALEHPITEAQVAIVWVTDDRAVFDVVIDQLTLVEGGVTSFDIPLERTPIESSLADCTLRGSRPDENHLGFGWIAVALQGVLPDRPVDLDRVMDLRRDGWILGFAEDNVVVWVGEEMLPDTRSSQILSGTFTPGPYLMTGRDQLSLAPRGHAVPISLTDSENGFRVPFFPWRACTNVAPPAEATQSLDVDVSMTTTGWGPST